MSRPAFDGARLRDWFGGGLSGNFWRLWGSTVAANLADGIGSVVLPLVAVRLTDSPAAIAGVSVAFGVPGVAFGLIAGGLADRLDRRWTMLAVQVLRSVVLASLTVLAISDALTMPALYVSAFVIGTGEAFFDTNAQSITPQLVGRDRLVAANGRLFAAETVMNSFVGPPLGGLLIALSLPLALGGAFAGYALAALGLVMIAGRFRAEREGPARNLAAEIGEGLGYLVRHPLLRTLTGLVAASRLGSGAFFAVFALWAVMPGPMGLSEPAFGVLFLMLGLGSLLGSLVASPLVARLGRANVLALSQLAFGLTLAVPVFTAQPLLVGGAFFVAGIAIMCWNVTNVSLRQAIVRPALLGRVHASHRFIANVAGLTGAATAGAIGETVGLPAVFAIGAAVVVASVVGRLVVTEDRIAAAEAEADR